MTVCDSVSTTVVNLYHRPQGQLVYVHRPYRFGNPFTIGPDGTRAQVIQRYRAWIIRQPRLLAGTLGLRGYQLACYCAPLPCHADILVRLTENAAMTMQIAQGCPRCGPATPLAVRTNPASGLDFLGCSSFPRCPHTQPLPPDLVMRSIDAPMLPLFAPETGHE